ncbi:MAG TPA: hypothetical protein VK668_13160 [Mucilaginibacter sp.]|nr:hypothetical protein [Mucilaginibacter sp.]
MRIVFNYYKILLTVNIPFSFIFGYIYGVPAFLASFCTFGLLISAFYFELYYKQRYYFYFNRGFTKLKLISYSFVANIILVALFFTFSKLIH